MTKGWTEERRRKQAENIRKTKPWEKSTGPRSAAGKKRCSMNAYKEGYHSGHWKAVRQALLLNREFLRHFAVFLAADQHHARLHKPLTHQTEGK